MSSELSISDKVLQAAVRKRVSDELGKLFQQLAEFTGGMDQGEVKKAKHLILTMMSVSADEFFLKINERVNKKQVQPE